MNICYAILAYGTISYKNKGHGVRSGEFDEEMFYLWANADFGFAKLLLIQYLVYVLVKAF